MDISLLNKTKLKNILKKYELHNVNNEPLGNLSFNIYDCIFSTNLYVGESIIPLNVEVKYYSECNISGNIDYSYITLICNPINNENIKLICGDNLGLSVSCRYCNNCKEYLIKKFQNHIKVPYLTQEKREMLQEYSQNYNVKFCLKDNSPISFYTKYYNDKLYLDTIVYKIKKKTVKNIFIPNFGENCINPLFKITSWECELFVNNKKIKVNFEDNDIPQNSDFYKKTLNLYISPTGLLKSLNEYEIKYDDILTYSVFVHYNDKKIKIKHCKNIPIGKIMINGINKKTQNVDKKNYEVFESAEIKYKNDLYFGSYLLRPDIIKKINNYIVGNNNKQIKILENDKSNYYYNLQYICCNISTNNLIQNYMT
jgi:hypothetical protein